MLDLKGIDFVVFIVKLDMKVIFIIVYFEYVFKGFELNVLDYLLKFIIFNWFLIVVEKFLKGEVIDFVFIKFIVIKFGYDLYKVLLQEILYIESDGEYVYYYLDIGKKIIVN